MIIKKPSVAMRLERRAIKAVFGFVLLISLALPAAAPAYDGGCTTGLAKVESAQGRIEARVAGGEDWEALALGDILCPGDSLRVRNNSRAALTLTIPLHGGNENTLRLDQNTSITFPENTGDAWIKLSEGVVHFISRLRRSFEVVTPYTNAGIDGTEFVVAVDSEGTRVTVLEGRVRAGGPSGEARVAGGESVFVAADGAPPVRTPVNPIDAVQWALFYPSVTNFTTDVVPAPDLPEEQRRLIRRSLRLANEGQFSEALELLNQTGIEFRDPAMLSYRASLYLGVGRVEEAGADLDRALDADNLYAHALALKAIIAVAQNANDEALALAKRAVAANPANAPAGLALSYAYQARFDLRSALDAIRRVVVSEPRNLEARARMAELYLAMGYVNKALTAARAASAPGSYSSRSQALLGFVFLAQFKAEAAEVAFVRAIELDSADPLPRLGRGLAMIRRGDLKEGRRQIEIATSLDPNKSIVRSYLGKAYFEEKRGKVAAAEFDMAKTLDPNDPTPWYYDAIRKQSENRPVEALEDLQKSIELNDNRAVYRSRLMLDSDLAARSASLGRVYQDLGFEQLALAEGWKSLNYDPGDFSAHRFLADSYAVLPRHKRARVSELLQAQMLQPINLNPLQPQLAESNLGILDGAGPSSAGFNEFNPLFTRNRLALQANGVVASDDTRGDDLVFSGVHDRLSYSIGQFHYETDGWRENADLQEDIYNLFAQSALTHKTNLQVEFRHGKSEAGDRSLQFFDEEVFLKNTRSETKAETARIGMRYTFSPGSDLLASFIHSTNYFEQGELTPTVTERLRGSLYELQHLYRWRGMSLVSGLGFYEDRRNTEIISFITIEDKTETKHSNAYLYTTIPVLKSLALNVGFSADAIDDTTFEDTDRVNPKLGLIWSPLGGTTVRAAAFRVLNRSMPTDQTLEPTSVAGFGQYFDDAFNTDAKVFGLALDQSFSAAIYGGLEVYKRKLSVPTFLFTFPTVTQTESEQEEWHNRAYLYWTPVRQTALSFEYQREKYIPDDFKLIEPQDTHELGVGMNYYHPTGVTGRVKALYVAQDGAFSDPSNPSGPRIDAEDKFWTMDAELAYRLPRRFGLIAVGGRNLLDKSFNYQEIDPGNPRYYPQRLVYTRLTLSF